MLGRGGGGGGSGDKVARLTTSAYCAYMCRKVL